MGSPFLVALAACLPAWSESVQCRTICVSALACSRPSLVTLKCQSGGPSTPTHTTKARLPLTSHQSHPSLPSLPALPCPALSSKHKSHKMTRQQKIRNALFDRVFMSTVSTNQCSLRYTRLHEQSVQILHCLRWFFIAGCVCAGR